MNDDLSKKVLEISKAFSKAKSFGGILSGVDFALAKSMDYTNYSNQALFTGSSLMRNSYFESKNVNAIMAAFENVNQMMGQIDIKSSYNSGDMSHSVFALIKTLSNENEINSFVDATKNVSTLLNNINFDTTDWIESKPYKMQYGKHIQKLFEWSEEQKSSAIIDDSTVLLDIDDNQIEEIFKITNEAFKKLSDPNNNTLSVLNNLLEKFSKFAHNQYTVGIVLILLTYYFGKIMEEKKTIPKTISIEKLISEKEIGIKHKPIKKYKDFEKNPNRFRNFNY